MSQKFVIYKNDLVVTKNGLKYPFELKPENYVLVLDTANEYKFIKISSIREITSETTGYWIFSDLGTIVLHEDMKLWCNDGLKDALELFESYTSQGQKSYGFVEKAFIDTIKNDLNASFYLSDDQNIYRSELAGLFTRIIPYYQKNLYLVVNNDFSEFIANRVKKLLEIMIESNQVSGDAKIDVFKSRDAVSQELWGWIRISKSSNDIEKLNVLPDYIHNIQISKEYVRNNLMNLTNFSKGLTDSHFIRSSSIKSFNDSFLFFEVDYPLLNIIALSNVLTRKNDITFKPIPIRIPCLVKGQIDTPKGIVRSIVPLKSKFYILEIDTQDNVDLVVNLFLVRKGICNHSKIEVNIKKLFNYEFELSTKLFEIIEQRKIIETQALVSKLYNSANIRKTKRFSSFKKVVNDNIDLLIMLGKLARVPKFSKRGISFLLYLKRDEKKIRTVTKQILESNEILQATSFSLSKTVQYILKILEFYGLILLFPQGAIPIPVLFKKLGSE